MIPLPPSGQAVGKPDTTATRTLIDDLLAEQRELTAVELFSRAHDAHEVRGRRYGNLLPASAPARGQQYAFEVDLDQCSGCKACVTACHSLNGLEQEETWRSVGVLISQDWRTPETRTITTACHHCADPGCLNGCPVLAYDKDPVTGIVRHLDDQCIGCQYCVMKCPYEVPQYSPNLGIVRKCDMCANRLAVGEAPACVQACPNAAISITLIETEEVTVSYRDYSPSDQLNRFLPASPDPAITVPTTRYLTSKPYNPAFVAGDAQAVRPAKAHVPLTFMLVLSQLGVGMFAFATVSGLSSRAFAAIALAITMAGLIAGTLHLGQPLKAWRGFLGWRTSWLSRELVAFGAFCGAAALHVTLLHPLTGLASVLVGLAGVFCSGMIYVDTHRPYWSAPTTMGKFFTSTALLGGVGALAWSAQESTSPRFRAAAVAVVMVGTLIKLGIEHRLLRHDVGLNTSSLTPLNKSARLWTMHFGLWSRSRIGCALVGGVLIPSLGLAIGDHPRSLVMLAAALVLTGELIERHLFFVAEAAVKMPGGK
jgi:formate dehydrogenase iron-sulfur subunit